jgi:hypothetical protein
MTEFHPYVSEDRQVLVDLMREYAVKTISICQEIEIERKLVNRLLRFSGLAKSRPLTILEKEARHVCDNLEKAVRVTIEIQDQIETNIARKLELDCRISDTYPALDYYYSLCK